MRLKYTVLIAFMLCSYIFPQIFQGPANGSVPSGVTVTTGTFGEDYNHTKIFKSKPLRNLFTRLKIADSPTMPQPTGIEGSNYVEDSNIEIENSNLGGDFSLTKNFQGIPDQGWSIPPDPYVAVGPTHIVSVVNSRFRISDKTGNTVSTIEASSWYNSTLSGADPFDPKVTYDHFAKRWIMVWLHLSANSQIAYFLISVSDDSIPTGTWYNWKIPSNVNGSTASGNWADYQGVGYDNNAVYLTSNQFTPAGSWNYCKIRILKKSDLYANTAGALNWTDLWDIKEATNQGVFGLRPTRVYNNLQDYYLVARSPYVTGTYFTLYKLSNPTTTPALTAVNIPVTAYSDANDPQQLGSTQKIDGGGSEIRNEAVLRDGKISFVHSVKSGTGGAYSAIRYVTLNIANNTVVEDKSMGADGFFHTYPALEVDKNGNMVITYTRTGSTEYAGAYYTTKPAASTSPTGSKVLKTGSGPYYKTFGGDRNRWGDYNGAWLDPSDPSKIWIFTEYVASTNTWGTWTGELTFQESSSYTTVLAPDGGENWQVNSNKNITWTSSNVTNVKIEYSTNNGTNWTLVTASVPAASGSYAWTIPSTPSSQCLVKISDVANPATFDISNSPFTISSSGLSWESVTSGTTGDIWSIDWVNSQVVWLLAANGDIRRSTDGGNTWISAGNVGQEAYSIAALNSQTAVVATGPNSGNGKIVKTTNGGTNWVQKYTVSGAWFNFIDNISETELWALADPLGDAIIGVFYHIVYSTDAGETWTLANNRPSAPASNVYGANGSFYRIGNTCWFGCGGATGATFANRVYKSVNSYNGPWTFSNTSAQFTGSIAFSSPGGNGLVGFWQAENTLNKSADGGFVYSPLTVPIGLTRGLDYIQNTPYCWAATSTGLYKTSDNGTSWTPESIPAGLTDGLNSVKFYNDANVGLAGGNAGVLLISKLPPVVPVELTSFAAEISSQAVTLNWATASEVNNRGFEIQKNFGNNWITIGFVPGNGSSSNLNYYTFTDNYSDNSFSGIVTYRLRQFDYDGKSNFSDEISLSVDFSAKDYSLEQNYPNPFNPVTTISYSLPKSGMVSLKVYDNLGREIITLVNEEKESGKHKIEFDASGIASGVYYYKIISGDFSSTKKLILMK